MTRASSRSLLPNQDHQQTEAMAAKVTASGLNGIMTCLVPPYFVWANFSDEERHLELPQDLGPAGSVKSLPRSVGMLHRSDGSETWRPVE